MSEIKTSYWYRKGAKEGAWTGFGIILIFWAEFSVVTLLFALWLKWAPPITVAVWTAPIWFAAAIWLYFRWLDWRYPVTKLRTAR